MHRNKSVSIHQFSMVPKSDIPRSKFNRQFTHKTTFDAGGLIPIYVDEVLPGDTFNLNMTAFCRLATPIVPVMDNLHLESFFFFVPNRLVWTNWVKFMGEQENPDDTTDYLLPEMSSPTGGYAVNSVFDHFGLPTIGQVSGSGIVKHTSLPLRGMNLIWNEWFRDENLQDSVKVNKGDTSDPVSDYTILKRGKRHDYFTSALPWPQKGESVTLPLGTSAPVVSNGAVIQVRSGSGGLMSGMATNATSDNAPIAKLLGGNAGQALNFGISGTNTTGLYADLSEATAATINQLRQSFAIQRLLEKDARGGTRYTEIIRQHFGVLSPDARLQRPEYLGGGYAPVTINPIAQTSGTPKADGYTTTPQGNLSAMGTALATGHGFTQSFVEHGFVLGFVAVRADLTYQQGIRRMWNRKTRYDFYFPTFANLGEQTILNKEIYCTGLTASDDAVFGYQERWSEYRYLPSMITGLFKSTSAGTIDVWHLAQRFNTLPVLNESFIVDNPPVERITAVGAAANGQQFLFDGFFNVKSVRPMPMYSVPGLIDHF